MKTPYIGFGNKDLEKCPTIKLGDFILCPSCGKEHKTERGTIDGKESDVLLLYKCGEKIYLAAIAGRNIIGVKSTVSGSVDLSGLPEPGV